MGLPRRQRVESRRALLEMLHPGRKLYALYRKEPPTKGGASHRVAYFHGYNGVPHKYVTDSIAWWAYKAGKDNRSDEKGEMTR